MTYYLAIDIGASSGRHILASIQNNKVVLEEIYRFKNSVVEIDGHCYWDIDSLFYEVKQGIKMSVEQNKIPKTIGIDTWAVDYILLDKKNQKLSNIYAYRDNRVDKFVNQYNYEKLYQLTGIQFQKFNTIYQLASEDKQKKSKTKSFLMVPDYLNFLLTGKKMNEYTNMSTTQLLDCKTKQIDLSLVEQSEISKEVFMNMVMPGTNIGSLSYDIQEELGLQAQVVVPATHDTGSAYMSAIEEDSIIISSGTWSLLGIETLEPIITEESMKANFTNEGGFDYRYRFLKNIMGLWIIQEVAREFQGEYSFAELVKLARENPFDGVFDVNDNRFLKPDNMVDEITRYFKERKENVPCSVGEISYCVYHSLAISYMESIHELEMITNKSYPVINIIGGGCQNELLNEMIAETTHKKVVAGPIEATALGNILAQMISEGVVKDLVAGRELIRNSFGIRTYEGEKKC